MSIIYEGLKLDELALENNKLQIKRNELEEKEINIKKNIFELKEILSETILIIKKKKNYFKSNKVNSSKLKYETINFVLELEREIIIKEIFKLKANIKKAELNHQINKNTYSICEIELNQCYNQSNISLEKLNKFKSSLEKRKTNEDKKYSEERKNYKKLLDNKEVEFRKKQTFIYEFQKDYKSKQKKSDLKVKTI